MSEIGRSQPTKSLLILLTSGFFFWALLIVPAWLVADLRGVIGLTISGMLCLLPGCIALGFKAWLGSSQSAYVLVAGGLRLGFVLAGALGAKFAWPEFGLKEFFIWLVLYYLFVLAIETWLTVRNAA